MTEYIVKRWQRFDNFVSLFTTRLGQPARRHLVALLIALIIWEGRKNLAGLNRALFAPCHNSSLFRFIGEASWSVSEFEAIRQTELTRRVRRYLDSLSTKTPDPKLPVRAFLCIDDTNNPKSGTDTPWASYQYSHSVGKAIRCWCLVTALMVIGPYRLPFAFRLYRRQQDCLAAGCPERFLTKIELACALVEQWQPPTGTQGVVLVDSWYVSDELLAVCAKRGFTLIGGIKANRQISSPSQPLPLALSKVAPQIAESAYQSVTLAKQRFLIAAMEVKLKGDWTVKLLVNRAVAKIYPKSAEAATVSQAQYSYRYFVSTDRQMSAKTICELYAMRWEIETFHAHLKELLGFDHNQCRLERNVERLWTLVLIAYSYLMLEAAEAEAEYRRPREAKVTLGQVVADHKRLAHQGWAEWIYVQAKLDCPLDQILTAFAV